MPVIRATSESIARAAQLLRAGELVAFPTETVYGLGANALSADAVAKIFAAKGRPSYNPLIVHIPDTEAARALVTHWPPHAAALADAFWPGPLTLVLPKQDVVPDLVTAGLRSVALRVPAHPVALALLHACSLPIAAPSANRFTELSPTTAAHVARALGERVALVLDGGPTDVGIESTVVDLTGDVPMLLRPGSISSAALGEIVGQVEVMDRDAHLGEAPRPAPGMIERHYAPRATLLLVDTLSDQAWSDARELIARGSRVGAVLLTPAEVHATHVVHMPHDPAAYAQRLYGTLHDLDDAGCALILVERVPDAPSWAGVRDRLARAAT